MDVLTEADLKVPDDIGLMGVNDMDMARWRCFRLTTIRQPIAWIISASVDLALAQIDDPGVRAKTRLFPCEVIRRDILRRV